MAEHDEQKSIDTIIHETINSQIFWTEMVGHFASFALDLRFSVSGDFNELINRNDEINKILKKEKMINLLVAGKVAGLTFIVEDKRSNRKIFLAPLKYILLFEDDKFIRSESLGTFFEGGPVDVAKFILRHYLGVRDFDPSGQFYVDYSPLLNLSRLLRNLWINVYDSNFIGQSVPLRADFNALMLGDSLVIKEQWLQHIGIHQDLKFGLTRGIQGNNLWLLPQESKLLLESLLGKS
jgi:hypothetical protein